MQSQSKAHDTFWSHAIETSDNESGKRQMVTQVRSIAQKTTHRSSIPISFHNFRELKGGQMSGFQSEELQVMDKKMPSFNEVSGLR